MYFVQEYNGILVAVKSCLKNDVLLLFYFVPLFTYYYKLVYNGKCSKV